MRAVILVFFAYRDPPTTREDVRKRLGYSTDWVSHVILHERDIFREERRLRLRDESRMAQAQEVPRAAMMARGSSMDVLNSIYG